MDRVRVALVGAGYQGARHAVALAELSAVELVGICDLDESRAVDVARRVGADEVFTSYESMLAAERPDLVSICTMPASHCAIALASFDHGAHVLCEKPLATSLAEGAAMAAAAERAGRFLTVAYNMRWMGSARVLYALVRDGSAGRPLYCRTWLHETTIPWWGPHYERGQSGGGVMAASAGHVLDVALWVAGYRRPVSVFASSTRAFPAKRGGTAPSADAAAAYDVEDLVAAHIRFDDGFFMTLEAGWGWDRLGDWNSFELVAERRTLGLEPLSVIGEVDGVPVDLTPTGVADTDWDASVTRGIHAVVGAVRRGEPPLVTPAEALTAQAITDAIYASAASGGLVEPAL